jgi:hypothetical protein
MQNSAFAGSKLRLNPHKNSRDFSASLQENQTQKSNAKIGRLHMSTVRWARNISSKIRPRELVMHHPLVANSLADAWDQPHVFAADHQSLCNWSRTGTADFCGSSPIKIRATEAAFSGIAVHTA